MTVSQCDLVMAMPNGERDNRPPSRETNPFATCWTSPGKFSYVEPEANELAVIEKRLEEAGGWGALMGPHGSGKSAMLRAIESCWQAGQGFARYEHLLIVQIDRHKGAWLSNAWLPSEATAAGRTLCLLEGFERLGWFARQAVLWKCWRRSVHLIATRHPVSVAGRLALPRLSERWPWRLQPIAELKPDLRLIRSLFEQLVAREPQAAPLVTWADALQAIERLAGGSGELAEINMRELWFALYLLHEDRRRG